MDYRGVFVSFVEFGKLCDFLFWFNFITLLIWVGTPREGDCSAQVSAWTISACWPNFGPIYTADCGPTATAVVLGDSGGFDIGVAFDEFHINIDSDSICQAVQCGTHYSDPIIDCMLRECECSFISEHKIFTYSGFRECE